MSADDPTGYVPVRDEPMHRRRFENEWVRVYDAYIPAQTKTLYHEHVEDTVYIALTGASFSSQKFGRDRLLTDTSEVGDVGWNPHRSRPLIHEVANTGDHDIRLIGAEIKNSTGFGSPEPMAVPCWNLGEVQERVRSYSLRLDGGASSGVVTYDFSRLTVILSTAVVEIRGTSGESVGSMILSVGDTFWHREPCTFSIHNIGEQPVNAAMVEWR